MSEDTAIQLLHEANSDEGLRVSSVEPYTLIQVHTRNSVYEVLVISPERGEVLVCSNHPRWPGPLSWNSGQLWQDCITIQVGKPLYLYDSETKEGMDTSRVRKVEIINNDLRKNEMLNAKDVPATGVSKIEFIQKRAEVSISNAPTELREWADGFISHFRNCNEGHHRICKLISGAIDAEMLDQARPLLEEAFQQHWSYQHPERRGALVTLNDPGYYSNICNQIGIEDILG